VDPGPVGALQSIQVPASQARSAAPIVGLDAGHDSNGVLDDRTTLVEPGKEPRRGPSDRPAIDQPESSRASVRKPPRQTLRGQATFYHHGSTAMRLPRGTTVIICGDGGCVTRVVDDYGPTAPSRIVDLYVEDFFDICGCPSWSGVTAVTVYVY
jgi:hypothetical protein